MARQALFALLVVALASASGVVAQTGGEFVQSLVAVVALKVGV